MMSKRAFRMVVGLTVIGLCVSATYIVARAQSGPSGTSALEWSCSRDAGAQAGSDGVRPFVNPEPLSKAWQASISIKGDDASLRLLPGGEATTFKVERLPDGTLLLVQRTQRPSEMPQAVLLNTRTRSFLHVQQLALQGGATTNIGYMSVGTCR